MLNRVIIYDFEAFICAPPCIHLRPPEIGPLETRFWGASNELLGGAANEPLICSRYAPFCGTKPFFVWGALNELKS